VYELKIIFAIRMQCWINHCTDCTMAGGPRRQGPVINCHFLPRCFDIWTLKKRSQTRNFVFRNIWFKR